MELEKVLRLIANNKDINPAEFDVLLVPALKEAVVEGRDLIAKRGYGVCIGLVEMAPKTIADGYIEWRAEFDVGKYITTASLKMMVSVGVIDSGALSYQPRIIVCLAKEDGTQLYNKMWNYPADGFPCIKCLIMNAMDKSGLDRYGIDMEKIACTPKQTEEWFFMVFWKGDGGLKEIVRDADYEKISAVWQQRKSEYTCTPIMSSIWPSFNAEKQLLGKLSEQVAKDNDFMVLASEFGHWAESVKIGEQEWTTHNLRLDDGEEGIYVERYTGETYYTWDAAMRVAGKIPGWHLPTREEWQELAKFCNAESRKNLSSACAGEKLKSTHGWNNDGNGTDWFGFDARPVGWYSPGDSMVSNGGNVGLFWSATPNGTSHAYSSNLYCDDGKFREGNNIRSLGYSVRLLKDSAQQEVK